MLGWLELTDPIYIERAPCMHGCMACAHVYMYICVLTIEYYRVRHICMYMCT